ncbi:MAG: hypothetical protein IPN48_16305 [Sphingomonadales bacterium]|nr:hypothetical protein [Sphingomonadales bacterium]
MDEDGYIYIVDRKKDVIIAGGCKVAARSGGCLYQHPAVREAAVVGVADDYRGETVKAVVSLRPGIQADPDEIREFCKDRLAAYKYPRIVEIIDELPKDGDGQGAAPRIARQRLIAALPALHRRSVDAGPVRTYCRS